jgi:hypothetical protein
MGWWVTERVFIQKPEQGEIDMATIELGPGAHYADATLATRSPGMRRILFPAVRWGAVFAGVAVGVSIQLVLSLLGLATGLSNIDVNQGQGISSTGPLLWAALSMLISALVGGYVAARMSGLKRRADGIMHGAVSWAVTTLMFATLATSVSGAMVSGIFNNVAPTLTQSAGAGDTALTSMLRGQVGNGLDANTMQRLMRDIQAGRRDDAISLLSGSGGMDPARAGNVVDQALILSGSPERASPSARQAANRAVEVAGTTAWLVFLAVALSLVLSLIGGALRAIGARRQTWSGAAEAPTPP